VSRWDFAAELARHGPRSPGPPPGLLAARGYCARVARTHYENFTVASVLLPRNLLPHFHAVYAYCRWADDLADETGGGDTAVSLLGWWRGGVLRMYAGEVRHPVFVALADTVTRFNIPPEPFLDLLTAFEQDQRQKRYATFADVLNYCRNSANPVGRLVLHLFRCADDTRLSLSDEICTGLQLANFWQDVSRDFAIGRVYLPLEDLARFGVTEDDIAVKRCPPAFVELMRFQVGRTRGYFGRGRALLPLLPREVRADVELFVRGGEATLEAIEKQGFDVLTGRPVVTKWEKAKLLGRAVWQILTSRGP
jgi:squalene synthase HpnC